jgi:peptidoglycan/xylan/chitin deacetylase (PgdA/CDA1 family)
MRFARLLAVCAFVLGLLAAAAAGSPSPRTSKAASAPAKSTTTPPKSTTTSSGGGAGLGPGPGATTTTTTPQTTTTPTPTPKPKKRTSGPPAPFAVQAATLTQDAQDLLWHVQLGHRFAPAKLTKGGRSLCLLIERTGNSSVSGVACVQPTKDGQHSQLVYQHVTREGRGKPQPMGATISRRGARDLTARFRPSAIGNTSYQPLRWQVLSTLATPACTPAKPNPLGCTLTFPAKSQLAKLHLPALAGCVPTGSPFVSHGPRNQRVVALTFDDGPWPDTPQFLKILESKHVVATFFQIGEQVHTFGDVRLPDGLTVERQILADGDILGDHTWSHPYWPFPLSQVDEARDAIRQATGFNTCLFRAPGGTTGSGLINYNQSVGLATIQWDVDPRDWARPGTGAIYSTVVGTAQNGSIILQHDGGGPRDETLAALPREIDTLKARGYQFLTIPQLLGYKLLYK